MNLAARAAVLKYLVIFVNENDDFSLLREKDKSGRDAISWIEELVEEDFDTYEEIMDFLYDHDPGIDSDDEESVHVSESDFTFTQFHRGRKFILYDNAVSDGYCTVRYQYTSVRASGWDWMISGGARFEVQSTLRC